MANDIRRYINLLKETVDKKTGYEGGSQHDWIVYDVAFSKLFCLTIESEDDKIWRFTEFVNMFDTSKKEIGKSLSMGYHTMLLAAMGRDLYNYNIANHTFSKKDILSTDYWTSMISEKKFWGKTSLNIEIDYEEFVKEVKKLVPANTWTQNN